MILVDDLVVRAGLWGLGSVYIFPGEMKNKKCKKYKRVILEFRINPVHHLTILELSIKSPCLWTCFHPLSPVSWKMLNRPKKVNAVSTKSTAAIFSSVRHFAPFVFTL
jgi:hypothetical protein